MAIRTKMYRIPVRGYIVYHVVVMDDNKNIMVIDQLVYLLLMIFIFLSYITCLIIHGDESSIIRRSWYTMEGIGKEQIEERTNKSAY